MYYDDDAIVSLMEGLMWDKSVMKTSKNALINGPYPQ